jgi:hypothetical protein
VHHFDAKPRVSPPFRRKKTIQRCSLATKENQKKEKEEKEK